jgi:phosphoglycerol transferase
MALLCRPWIRFASYAVGFFLLACVRWITILFGGPTIQQILYHLHFFGDLLGTPDRWFVATFVVECLIAPLLLAAAVVFVERVTTKPGHETSTTESHRFPKRSQFIRQTLTAFPSIVLLCGLIAFSYRYSVPSYLASRFGQDRFADLYVDPGRVQLQKSQQKNLVLIYVESLEVTYSDQVIFGKNLLEQLDLVPGVSFSSFVSAPGTGWTIAAMVGTQCGLPLQFVTRMNDMETGEHVTSFLPGAICLPDVLHVFGYENVFLGAAPLSFAGKGNFLKTHHYDEAYGNEEWLKAQTPRRGTNAWGLYDDDLFALAEAKLTTLHKAGRPFNLTLLTIDTHQPNGFFSGSCRAKGAKNFQGIVQCVSGELADFVDFARSNGYLEDTNIVIIGDHLANPNPVYAQLLSSSHRTIYNKFISIFPFQKSTEEIIPFDLYPTLLEFVGIQVDGQRLALGRSAIFRGITWPRGSRPEVSEDILNFSRKYEQLWIHDANGPLIHSKE